MRPSGGRVPDTTGDTAVGDVAGGSLLVALLSRIEDKRERVLILAHIGLGMSLTTLARDLKLDRRELAKRVERILAELREDNDLAVMLSGIDRAGRPDHYQALAYRLDLQDWFCSHCGRFIIQPEIGRPRITCSNKCRRLHNQVRPRGLQEQRGNSSTDSHAVDSLIRETQPAKAERGKLLELVNRINLAEENSKRQPDIDWDQPDNQIRDRALILLGFRCPIPLSTLDLAALNVDDAIQTTMGLEVRLYRWARRETRYVTMPIDTDDPHALHGAGRNGLAKMPNTNWSDYWSSIPKDGPRTIAV